MKKFLAQYFFDIDKTSALDTLKKFINGDLPEHDVSKKPSTKRKSDATSGPSEKRTKLEQGEVEKNQETLID